MIQLESFRGHFSRELSYFAASVRFSVLLFFVVLA